MLHGQLRLSGCFKCNVQAEHNDTGMGILQDTEGSHCTVEKCGRVSCSECVKVHEHE